MASKLKNKAGSKEGTVLRFMDDYDDEIVVEFRKKKAAHRGIELDVVFLKTLPTGRTKMEKCSMGHEHEVPATDLREYHCLTLDEADARNLRNILNDRKWLP